MADLIDIDRVDMSYGAVPVLKKISLTVKDGETLAIIGPNGAGKTTLFKVLTGEAFAVRGRISLRGRDITRVPADKRVGLGFGRTFQVARIFGDYTVKENVIASLEARDRQRGRFPDAWLRITPSKDVQERATHWLESVNLAEKRHLQARYLSHGDKKRLELAMVLALDPSVLLLDEPTAGMSPADRHATVELIAGVRGAQALTVMLTEHDMDVVFGLADRVMVLNYGEIIAMGPAAEVRNNAAVREVYLGSAELDA
jgi:branched-chain amino acid transport system ATP-binding protein